MTTGVRRTGGVPPTLRAAGWLSIALGLAFGGAMMISLEHLARRDELPMTPFGFRAFAGGPFDALPRAGFLTVAGGLLVSSSLDLLAGIWLWRGDPRGRRLALATITTPLDIVLGVGFALPFLLVGVPIRAALIARGRRGLR
jgi:hypothetical protein